MDTSPDDPATFAPLGARCSLLVSDAGKQRVGVDPFAEKNCPTLENGTRLSLSLIPEGRAVRDIALNDLHSTMSKAGTAQLTLTSERLIFSALRRCKCVPALLSASRRSRFAGLRYL